MGTSTDRGGGSGGAWTPLKRAATSFMNAADSGHGTGLAGQRLLARHVAVLGGVAGALAGAHGRTGAQRLGSLLSGIASNGLATTLSEQDLGRLVGGDRFTVLDALAGLIAGDGADVDAQATRDATFDVLAELFPDADSWADLDAVRVDASELVRLLELFLARYIYNRIPVIAERLARITDPAKAQRAEEDLPANGRELRRPTASRRPAARRLERSRGQEDHRGHTADSLRSARAAGGTVTAASARFQIRTAPFTGHASGPAPWLLDWAPGGSAETIEFTPGFFAGWQPDTAGSELLRFAAGVLRRDRVVLRRTRSDAWTRDLRIDVPVHRPRRMAPGTVASHTRLPHRRQLDPATATREPGTATGTGRAAGRRGVIVLRRSRLAVRSRQSPRTQPGHAAPSRRAPRRRKASTAQQALHAGLTDVYGTERVQSCAGCSAARLHPHGQERPLPDARERTTRSRSLLFLAGALAAAASCGPDIPVYLPENGWISLNVPLTRARTGSASTRTTHPHFLGLLTAACQTIGITNPLINPYRHRTKGEMLTSCSNPGLLARLAPASISCAHPETPRWRRHTQGNCGYCLPCMVRRASLARLGQGSTAMITRGTRSRAPELLDPAMRTGADLRAIVHGVSPDRDELDIIRNAPLPPGEHDGLPPALATRRRRDPGLAHGAVPAPSPS